MTSGPARIQVVDPGPVIPRPQVAPPPVAAGPAPPVLAATGAAGPVVDATGDEAPQLETTARSDDVPAWATIPNVELVTVGTWEASTGPVTFTADDLASAVAALDDPQVRKPVLKLGHTDPRFNGKMLRGWLADAAEAVGLPLEQLTELLAILPLDFDAQPAIGRVDNLRLDDDRMTLLGDYVGVPAWLAQVIPVAYPSRSIEGFHRFPTASKLWPFVMTGVALLGETLPAIGTLDDVRSLFYGPEEDGG